MSLASRGAGRLSGAVTVAVLAVSFAGCDRSAARAPVFLDASTHAPALEGSTDARVLRVCADPNNMPFSNRRGEGFENQIATLVAGELQRSMVYTWQPQRRGFIRTTLKAGACDLVIGVPSAFGPVRTTRPYYRSSYVFVSRRGERPPVRSFDDPRLKRLQIGIQVTGDDYNNPPGAQALASRGITRQVHGYTVYGDYFEDAPQRRVIDAVAKGEIDLAFVWGPLAGYFARRQGVPMTLTAVAQGMRGEADPLLPFAFDISMGVRHDDRALGAAVDGVIERRATDIRRILAAYAVPLIEAEGAS
jgi:mxaJ protein